MDALSYQWTLPGLLPPLGSHQGSVCSSHFNELALKVCYIAKPNKYY